MKNNITYTEKDLIKGIVKGDRKSYKILFDTYYIGLHRYMFKLSNDTILSEDLIQNVFLRIWEKKEELNITSSLKSYLFRSCHNEFLMHLRKQKREGDALDALKWEIMFEVFSEEETQDTISEDLVKLEKVIEKLPKKCKEVFKLSRFEQKKHKEIAEILGISTKTVEVHITKAIRFIKTNVSIFFL